MAIVVLATMAVGCKTPLQHQRETAILRAEILDLEDQYYAMKARCEGAERQLGIPSRLNEYLPEGNGIMPDLSGGVILDEPIIYESPQTNRYLGSEAVIANTQPYRARRPGAFFRRLFGGRRYSEYGEFANYDNGEYGAGAYGFDAGGPNGFEGMTSYQNQSFANDPLQLNISEGGSSDGGVRSNQDIEEIYIHPEATRGENTDGKPGDDGVVVFVQPRTKTGEVILSPGELTLSLIDPESDSEKKRIGLWKFTSQEVRLFEADQHNGEPGYLLHLPWDLNVPRSNQLKLYVRYRASDGRKIETAGTLSVLPPGGDEPSLDPLASGWTKRRVQAIPASTVIKRPEWRPTR